TYIPLFPDLHCSSSCQKSRLKPRDYSEGGGNWTMPIHGTGTTARARGEGRKTGPFSLLLAARGKASNNTCGIARQAPRKRVYAPWETSTMRGKTAAGSATAGESCHPAMHVPASYRVTYRSMH